MRRGLTSPDPDLTRLPGALARAFVALPIDREREAWLSGIAARPHGPLISRMHRALRRFVSDYDADGWLGTHPMHLLGTGAWRALVGREHVGSALLDVGAGSGAVTATLAPLFDAVVATETSRPMVRRLRARGIEAHEVDLAVVALPPPARRFRAVALLNVLDRSSRPRSLLRAARALLEADGIVIVACPLPVRPHVDVGGHTVDPDEPFDVAGTAFEDALGALVSGVIAPAGLGVTRWTRAPYLARGDRDAPLHALDDAVLVCSPT